MGNSTRRTAIKTLAMTVGTTWSSVSLPVSARLFASDESQQPIRLGVIADLHGGLAVDAEMRLDAFLQAMQGMFWVPTGGVVQAFQQCLQWF